MQADHLWPATVEHTVVDAVATLTTPFHDQSQFSQLVKVLFLNRLQLLEDSGSNVVHDPQQSCAPTETPKFDILICYTFTMQNQQENNYAFIDSQNVYKGTQKDLGWKIDWARFRTYLKHKYRVTRAYLFIGFMPEHNDIYDELQAAGFILKFKPVLPEGEDGVKGNVDADLVLQVMIDYSNYDKAVIVSSDGDFYSLARHLYNNKKLLAVLSPHKKTCSRLLRKSAKEKMKYMDVLQGKLAKRKGTV